ncbi:MAG: hypothetical protein V4564_07255 [Pseudomonadota bacterium]|uniref:hypothetical protein n=1 Tax=Sphingomonas sp. ERG5 TaxID=1381597 RepID=UPI00190FBF64|nr:hypothetical protein [Sphingomonas sp. ERG5]
MVSVEEAAVEVAAALIGMVIQCWQWRDVVVNVLNADRNVRSSVCFPPAGRHATNDHNHGWRHAGPIHKARLVSSSLDPSRRVRVTDESPCGRKIESSGPE